MGAHTLFVAMPRAGHLAYDADTGMLVIIHDGGEGRGGYEDGQVEDLDPTESDNYQQQSYTQRAMQQTYTQTGDGTEQQQHWDSGE
ncbi:Glucan endo-1,3-beta-glucosidase 5 [Hordeum vulgare]|nr:Glucan endo-1,3-beta-glucosidase 5 [Hordeum vulgare]